MSLNEFQFSDRLQLKILTQYVRRPQDVAGFVLPGYFQNSFHQTIAEAVLANREKHPKDKIDKPLLKELVQRQLNPKTRDDIWPLYKAKISEIFSASLDSRETVASLARDWVRERQFRRFLVDAEKDVNSGNYAHVAKRLRELDEQFAGPQAKVFHTFEDFENAPPLSFAIDSFLQNDGATLIGGLSGHGKTWIMLSMAKALLSGEPLWGHFKVPKKAKRVLYLVPECSLIQFKDRVKRMHLYKYVKKGRLLVHTLSAGPRPSLDDPQILAVAKKAHVFLDTALRFGDGDENQASDNQKGLAADIFTLLRAGAKTVTGAHHSPKAFSGQNVMTLENVLRGSGDIGAMTSTVWGVKQLDLPRNILHIENVKPRDFEPPKPFQLCGRPWIDQEGDFRMLKKPGECGYLDVEQPRSGAPAEKREQRLENIDLVLQWLRENPKLSSAKIVKRFSKRGITVAQSTVRGYKRQIASDD